MHDLIEVVVWDMGGVLIRTKDPSPRQELAEWLGMTVDEVYSIVFENDSARNATLGRISEEDHWNTIQNRLGLGFEDMQDFRTAFWGGDGMDQALFDYIQSLRPRFRTALLSNAWSGARQVMKERYNMLSAFDVSIFSAEIGLAKPDPAIYHYLLDRLAISPEKTVFIDDVKENVESAINVGMRGVVFHNRQQVLDDLALMGIK
ncbi:MAG: HAD family phosphatase [Chloroflexi bacterium]|nr:HAD family phosphatase [Chloroflexota bacterium]